MHFAIHKIFLRLLVISLLSLSTSVLADTWIEKNPITHPDSNFRGAIAVDEGRGVTVLFGGLSSGVGRTNETWEWDGNSWTLISTIQSPPPMSEISMAYNSLSGKILMVGNAFVNSVTSLQTWEYNGVTWTQLTPLSTPSPRVNAPLVFDSKRNVFVLYGGYFNPDGPAPSLERVYYQETWEFDGSDWVKILTADSPPSYNGAMVYDSEKKLTYFFCGWYATDSGIEEVNETWEYNGINWIQLNPLHSPPPRGEATMYFDKISGLTVLFAGAQPGGGFHYLNDTWVWDGEDWKESIVGVAPPYRKAAMVGFDPLRNKGVLFGGFTGSSSLSDTWEFELTSVTPLPTSTPTSTFTPSPSNTSTPTPTSTAIFAPTASPTPIITPTPSSSENSPNYAQCDEKVYSEIEDTLDKQLHLLFALGIEVSKKIKDRGTQKDIDYCISLKNNLNRTKNLIRSENSVQIKIPHYRFYLRKMSDSLTSAVQYLKNVRKASLKTVRRLKSRQNSIVQRLITGMDELSLKASMCGPGN